MNCERPEKQRAGAKEVAEKVRTKGELGKKHPSGAKARHILLALSARLKSCPDTKPLRLSFSAACKAVAFQNSSRKSQRRVEILQLKPP
jgi:hypothetical protein